MSQSQLQIAINHYRQQLLHHEASAERALSSAYAHLLATIEARLAILYREIEAKQQADETIPVSWLYENHRLQTLKQFVTGQISHYATFSQLTTTQLQRTGVQLGMQAAQSLLKASVPAGVHWTFGVPHPGAIANMVGATQAGSPLADLFNGFGEEAAKGVSDALIRGVTLGNNPRMVARDVEQALQVPRWRALTIARTEMLRSFRSSSLETMKSNSDVLESWVWTADLSVRTCPACIAMNGTEHDLSEEMASHVNCRCVQVPKTKPWSDILGPLGIDTSDIDETSIDIQDGADWFDNQDADTQKAILGSEARYQAYKDGASLKSMVGVSHDPKWGKSVYVKPMKELVR